jgi:predicted amidohydrolase YtcJ
VVLDKGLFSIDRYQIHSVEPDAVLMDGRVVSGRLE